MIGKPVKRRRDGSLLVRLPANGVQLLRDALQGLLDTLDPEAPEQVRLFPRAYADDAEEARFRDLTRGFLLAAKEGAIRRVLSAIERAGRKGETVELVLERDDVDPFLGAINDVRLVVGTILEVTDEEQPHELLPPDDPDAPRVASYLWLGVVQETVLETLLGELPD